MVNDEMRLVIADLFKIAHRRSCYPDAMQFEAEMFADSVLEAVAPAIRAAAMEEAVQIAIDMGCAEEATSIEQSVAQRAAHRRDMAFEIASALETKAARIRAAKEVK